MSITEPSEFEKRVAARANRGGSIDPDDAARLLGMLASARSHATTARAEGYAAAREQAARDVEASRDTSPRVKEGDSPSGAVLRDYTWRLLTRVAASIRAMRDGEGTT